MDVSSPVNIYIYALISSGEKYPRYIGQTGRSIKIRRRQHLLSSRKATVPKVNAWISGQIALGNHISTWELEIAKGQDSADEAEIFWMETFRSWGINLCNMCEGGSSRSGWRHTESAKKAMSEKRKGRPTPWLHADEVVVSRERTRQSRNHPHGMLGKRHSAEAKAKISESRKSVPYAMSPDCLAAHVDRMKKRWLNPEWRAKMSAEAKAREEAKRIVKRRAEEEAMFRS